MSRTDAQDGPDWDDVVDLICIGVNPGVLAYADACAADEWDVMVVDWPAEPDIGTREYLAAMAVDLGDAPAEPDPPATRAVPVAARTGRRGAPKPPERSEPSEPSEPVEPFVGEDLRNWSARCLASSSGVLFTEVPDRLVLMRTDTGELVTATAVPSSAPVSPATGETFAGLVIEYGRITGAVLDAAGARRLVRAEAGLVFAVGRAAGDPPSGPAVALVGRRGGRFARLEPLAVDDGE